MKVENKKKLKKQIHLTRRSYKRKDKSLTTQKAITEYEREM